MEEFMQLSIVVLHESMFSQYCGVGVAAAATADRHSHCWHDRLNDLPARGWSLFINIIYTIGVVHHLMVIYVYIHQSHIHTTSTTIQISASFIEWMDLLSVILDNLRICKGFTFLWGQWKDLHTCFSSPTSCRTSMLDWQIHPSNVRPWCVRPC